MRHLLMAMLLAGLFWAGGCTSAVQSGHNTALDGVDLVQMTDLMAQSIAGSSAVQEAIARDGRLRVVVEPVENNMRAEVLPRGAADAFTGRVRSLLSRHAADRFTWVMNRDAWHRLRAAELDFDAGPAPDSIQPQYALVAKFYSLTDESSRRRTSAYLCVYELTDLEHRTLLWTDKYEVKKIAVKGFLD